MAGSRRDWRVRTPHENIEDRGILEVYCRLGLLWGTYGGGGPIDPQRGCQPLGPASRGFLGLYF